MSQNPEPSEDNFVVEQLLEEAISVINTARSSIRSNNISVNRSEIIQLLVEAKEKFPEEIAAARWLLKERKVFIEKIQEEKESILDEAQKRATELVNRVEVVREAQEKSKRIIAEAQREVEQMKAEMNNYCEKQLARFEGILAKVYDEVQAGRAKLQGSPQEIQAQTELELEHFEPHFNLPQEEMSLPLATENPPEQNQSQTELDPLIG